MYVRQKAWLASTPKEMGEPRRAFIAHWWGEEKAATFDVEPGPLRWLIALWHQAGECRLQMGPMGGMLMGFTWGDIRDWVDGAHEQDLAVLFRRGIIELSQAFADVANGARTLEYQAPFDPSKD